MSSAMQKISYILLTLALSICLFSCSSMDKDTLPKIELINKINSHYYNLTNQNIESVKFQFQSLTFDNIPSQINNKELASLLSKIEFIVVWKRGSDISIIINNIPRLKNKDAKLGLDKMMSGMKKQIKGLFLTIDPVLNNPIKYKRGMTVSADQNSGLVISSVNKLKKWTESFYFDNSLKLLKTELIEKGKLSASDTMSFDLYNDKYILNEITTTVLRGEETKTDAKISYAESGGVYLPHLISMKILMNKIEVKDEYKLTPIYVKKIDFK